MANNTIVETTYSGRDNINVLQLQDDSVDGTTLANTDLTGATKVSIVFDDESSTSYNSTDDPNTISFEANGQVTLALGDASLPVGSYMAYFIVYDAVNTDGIRWRPKFRVRKK